MTVTAASPPAPSAGASPEELDLMRRAAARLSPAASGTKSAPDPFAALARPHDPGQPGPRATWHKFTSSGPHRCM